MKIISAIFLLFCSLTSAAQSIFDNPITGTNPNTDNPYTTGQNVNANITVSGIGRGSGINGNNANDRYNANSWNTSSIDLTAYFYWTLTPNAGRRIDLSSFVYTGQASGTGPTAFEFRSSLDNYTASIGAPDANGETIDLSGAAYQNITSAITFRLYGWNASGAGGTFSVNDFTFNGAVSLPVELLSFNARTEKTTIALHFSTATEHNNDYFSIERSAGGQAFTEIGRVQGAGDASTTRQYIFEDAQPLQGINYYRLRQVDFDGQYTYSPVVTALFGKERRLVLSPMPASENLRIQLDEAATTDGFWQVFDMTGRLMLAGELPAESSEQTLDISALPEGSYVLRLAIGQQSYSEQFRKNE
ncbi:MAG: T9SS type A sorting domain-containing protein [Saprospiraceae bacterium]|nr:T9SS type A sorting domain-containing protein [Saprospiraceae bacterium]